MKKEAVGTILALLTAIVSGVSIFANKIFIVDLDPTVFTAVRAMIIGIIFFIAASVSCKWDFSKFKKVSWRYLLVIGIIGGGIAFILFFSGLQLTTGGRAAFFHKTLPLYAAAFAVIFLKEKLSVRQTMALILMMLGTVGIYAAQIPPEVMWSAPMMGDLLVIAATILWAIENTIAKKAMNLKESNLVVSFGRMFFGAIFLWGVLLLMGNWQQLLTLGYQQILNIFASTGLLFAYVLFYYWSLKYINLSKAATILLLSPVITLMLGMTFLGEPAPYLQLLGSAVILVGAFLVTTSKSEIQARY